MQCQLKTFILSYIIWFSFVCSDLILILILSSHGDQSLTNIASRFATLMLRDQLDMRSNTSYEPRILEKASHVYLFPLLITKHEIIATLTLLYTGGPLWHPYQL